MDNFQRSPNIQSSKNDGLTKLDRFIESREDTQNKSKHFAYIVS
jgi:hypothetical protein